MIRSREEKQAFLLEPQPKNPEESSIEHTSNLITFHHESPLRQSEV